MELKFQNEYESQWVGKSEFFFDEQQIENMIINWDELNGKTLAMFSYKSEGIRIVGGKEETTGKIYILLEEREGSKDELSSSHLNSEEGKRLKENVSNTPLITSNSHRRQLKERIDAL